jgi:hypothetical protein
LGDGVGVVNLLLFIGVKGELEGLLPGVLGVLGDGVGELIGIQYLFILWINNTYGSVSVGVNICL